MRAYKFWYDEKNYVHKDSVLDNVRYTTNINEALNLPEHKLKQFIFDSKDGLQLNPVTTNLED